MFWGKFNFSIPVLVIFFAIVGVVSAALFLNLTGESDIDLDEASTDEIQMRSDDIVKERTARQIREGSIQHNYKIFMSSHAGDKKQPPIDYSKVYHSTDSKSAATSDRARAIENVASKLRHRLETEDESFILKSHQKKSRPKPQQNEDSGQRVQDNPLDED